MRPVDNISNLSQVPGGSALDSTTENNSESSSSDMEVLSKADGDQNRIIQTLQRTIKQNKIKINDLSAKLVKAEDNLASEKERTKDKDDVIKTLKLSIDVIKENSGQSVKRINCDLHKTIIEDLNADIEVLECKLKNRNEKISELEDKTEKFEIKLKEKDEHITNLESQIKTSLDTTQKYERCLKENDEQIAELESQAKADASQITKLNEKLSTFTLKVESMDDNSLVYLNCTKMPSIDFVKIPNSVRFAAVFEDLPSAGPDWMLIQRRIDGSVDFINSTASDFYKGFGDLSREFWLGCEKLHRLTTNQRHELYIELVDFDNATAFARYDHFLVGSAEEKYALNSVGKYSGNAGNYLRGGEIMWPTPFVVNKEVQNQYSKIDERLQWWINNECNLNGKYYNCKTILKSDDGIWWGKWNMGKRHSLKSCKMLIRPRP